MFHTHNFKVFVLFSVGSVLIFVTRKANSEELANNLRLKDFTGTLSDQNSLINHKKYGFVVYKEEHDTEEYKASLCSFEIVVMNFKQTKCKMYISKLYIQCRNSKHIVTVKAKL